MDRTHRWGKIIFAFLRNEDVSSHANGVFLSWSRCCQLHYPHVYHIHCRLYDDHPNTNLARVRFNFSSSCDGEASHRRGVRLRLESGDGDYNHFVIVMVIIIIMVMMVIVVITCLFPIRSSTVGPGLAGG